MILKQLKPRKALNKAYLKVKPNRTEIESFKTHLNTLLDRTNDTESEEFHKNLVSDFLKDTYYKQHHFINTKGRNDLVIHNGNTANSSVGVIIEAKKPTNRTEMIGGGNLNAKAFQELVLYYLRERITHKNLEVKHLVVTNINEWYIFDATLFDRLFAQNKIFVKQFTDFEGGRLADTRTDFFYKQIAEPYIAATVSEIEFTYFNIQDYQIPLRNADKADDNKLIALFKLLSPEHLLKLPFTNDSNSLDKRFYSELLHLIGLTETKEGSKKLIQRNKEGARNTGSILEDAIIQLDSLDKLHRLDRINQYGSTTQERLFNVGLELSITWINRILFLKLLEAQLITYHRSDKLSTGKGDRSYSFLNLDKIKNYDDLNSLFFQVLARNYEDRNEDVKKTFEKVPYLNSSLFEPTDMEQTTLFISNLKDEKRIPIYSQTVLKDQHGKKRSGHLNTLEYLFEFLNAYDFSSEGSEEIQEDNKTLINASVLGLIFEKINGYKDGSFFTPGFITMYMCRETIRRAVVQKFNEEAPLRSGIEGGHRTRRKILPYKPYLKELARDLRNNSTKAEIFLWKALKGKFDGKYDFHRQKPLDHCIADFFCHELKLVIEVDGSIHDLEETQEKDFAKECRLNEMGLNVLRFTNSDIYKNMEVVLEIIRQYIAGYEKGDLGEFEYENTPLNPLSRGDFLVGKREAGRQDMFKTLDDVYEQIGDGRLFTRQQANDLINSIKICDPAVGSGHFLVSALNEMIAVKNDLKILQDRDGKRLKEYHVEVVNDELIVTDEEGELFEYSPKSKESQRIQETLFHEKQTIIENCLFGVDINPNSVKICRLRLWIELLKHAYYDAPPLERGMGGVLQTLPNIDINIKCGNSLVSRFAIDTDLKQALKKSKWTIDSYKMAVATYRNAESKDQKREMERLIADIKSDFRSEINRNDPKLIRKADLGGKLFNLTMQTSLFEESVAEKKKRQESLEKIQKELTKLEAEIDEIKNNKIFENAFEWRFEFPEVLNDDGDFVGFDVVIGNPPYIRQEEFSELKPYLKDRFEIYHSIADLLTYFVELGYKILKQSGTFQFIISNKFTRANYGQVMRKFLLDKTTLTHYIDFSGVPVFDEATVDATILGYLKKQSINSNFTYANVSKQELELYSFDRYITSIQADFHQDNLNENSWAFESNQVLAIKQKIELQGIQLKDWDITINYGIKTGLNEAFIIDGKMKDELIKSDPKSSEIIKPMLRGRDIQKWFADFSDLWLINSHNGIKEGGIERIELESDYISVFNHLMPYKNKLIKRLDKGDMWYNLRNCAYIFDFEKPKIIYPELTKFLNFYLDTHGNYYTNNKCFILTSQKFIYWLNAFLNSKLWRFCFRDNFPELLGGTRELRKVFMELIPVKQISEDEELIFKDLILELQNIKKIDPTSDTSHIEFQIDQLVYQLYGLTEEEIAIVESSIK